MGSRHEEEKVNGSTKNLIDRAHFPDGSAALFLRDRQRGRDGKIRP